MSTLYVTEPGSLVRLSSQTLVVSKAKEKLAQVPLISLENILIFGNVQITTQAMAALLDEGIDVSYLSTNGKLRGRLTSTSSKNIFLRLGQYERHWDDDFQLQIAKSIVKAKIRNGKKFIQRYTYNHPEVDFQNELQTIDKSLKNIENRQTVHSLMGDEGVASAAYFKVYGKMFLQNFTFEKRSRRPPKDPVNALLSFGYSLLTNEILSLVTAHGLDPHIGFLHELTYGRPSLALDLVEEFRHPVIDRFVLNLVNRGSITPEHFEEQNNGIFLTSQGRKIFFKKYDDLKKNTTLLKESDLALKDILKHQVRAMAKTIKMGEPFKPCIFRN